MAKDLKPLFGFRHLVNYEATHNTSAPLQAKVGVPKGPPKTPVERPVLLAKVGLGKGGVPV